MKIVGENYGKCPIALTMWKHLIEVEFFFHFKTINMGYTIPCSGHTAKEVDFVYSTKFTFFNLNLFKGA